MTLQRDYEFRRENKCRIIPCHIWFLHIIISFLVDERLNFAIRLTKPEYFTRRNQELPSQRLLYLCWIQPKTNTILPVGRFMGIKIRILCKELCYTSCSSSSEGSLFRQGSWKHYSPSWCSEVNGLIRGVNLVNHASLQMGLLGIWVVALSGNGFVASLKIVTLKIITFSTEYKNVCLLFFSFQIPLPRRSLRHTRFVVPLFLNNNISFHVLIA